MIILVIVKCTKVHLSSFSECGSAQVNIDIRKLSSILGGLQTLPTSLEMHILHKSLAHVVLDFDDMRTLLVAPSATH